MENNKRKVKLKICKKEYKRNKGPPLKPDIMLITKDVMIPLKIPPPSTPCPPGKPSPIGQNCFKDNLKIEKQTQGILNQSSEQVFNSKLPAQNYLEQSTLQVKKIASEKKMAQAKSPKSSIYCSSEDKKAPKNSDPNEREASLLENEDLSRRINSDLVDFGVQSRKEIESVKVSHVEKLPTPVSSRNSMSSLTNSEETRSCSSSKSFEDSLPKFSSNIISSCESESNVSPPNLSPAFEYSRISIKNDNSNIIEDKAQSNLKTNLESAEIKSNLKTLNNPNNELGNKNIHKELTDSNLHPETNSKLEKTINDDHKNEREEKETSENDFGADLIRDKRIMIEAEYLLHSSLTNLESREAFEKINKSQSNIDGEKEVSRISNESECNLNLIERIPTMIELGYSLHEFKDTVLISNDCNHSCDETKNIDSGRRYSWQELSLPNSTLSRIKNETDSDTIYNNPMGVNLKESEEQIEMKYSWQAITPQNEELYSTNFNLDETLGNENNSKLTSTEDLDPNGLEVRYSWQKLTSKYLAGKNAVDNFTEMNHPMQNFEDVPKNTTNKEYLKDHFSPPGETFAHHCNSIINSKSEEKSQRIVEIGKIAAKSPLNNIISSMLPEIKLINRRSTFNETTPQIISNYKDNCLPSHGRNDINKSSTSYSSVSSIKHVIASLNEMVTEQKQMLDDYVRNHKLDNSNVEESLVNSIEKVEIFPATLHVLGNYIVRDIRSTNTSDQRNLLDSNNDDYLSSDNPGIVQNRRLDKPIENNSSEIIEATDFSSIPVCPISFHSDYYSTIFTVNNNTPPKINNPNKKMPEIHTLKENRTSLPSLVAGFDSHLIAKNWKPAIVDMEEIIELSRDAAHSMEEKDEAVAHKKNTGLKPRVEVSFRETQEAGDNKTRKDELLSRLELAMSKLKQSEEHIDANWNLDYSVLDIEEGVSDKEIKLPKKVEDHIKDIIRSAEEYLAKLEEQLNDLRNADDQIINSSERAFMDIDQTYRLLMDNLCKEIDKRRNLVRLETEVFKYEGLAPLRACKQEVDAQIRSTQHLIVLTENMLTHPITFNKERLGKIITATSHMGRIPAVPLPEELPYVTFGPPNEEIKKEIVDRISCLGCVLKMGPAQFTEVYERPAGLQLKWHVADPEYASEEQTFIVQKALGEITEPTSSAFETVYIGSETSCFVRDLPIDQQITLRVGIQVTDTAWSVHRIAKTSIPAYSWDMDNSDYLITNSGRIATKVTQNLSTLLSRSAQFSSNYIIEFKFLEAASGTDEEGIGLVFEPGGINETLKRNGCLLITPNGNIFMNGEQKLMQLPKMELGTRIIFTSEKQDNDTLRMTIECGNKAVTYDWTVPTPLHFAIRFSEHNKWNLMVK